MVNQNHEFDSSRTCNYCGETAESIGGGAENEVCPKRIKLPRGGSGRFPPPGKLPHGGSAIHPPARVHILMRHATIAALRLEPGDVLVVKLPPETSMSEADQMHDEIERLFPLNDVMMVSSDASVEIIKQTDTPAIVKD